MVGLRLARGFGFQHKITAVISPKNLQQIAVACSRALLYTSRFWASGPQKPRQMSFSFVLALANQKCHTWNTEGQFDACVPNMGRSVGETC